MFEKKKKAQKECLARNWVQCFMVVFQIIRVRIFERKEFEEEHAFPPENYEHDYVCQMMTRYTESC